MRAREGSGGGATGGRGKGGGVEMGVGVEGQQIAERQCMDCMYNGRMDDEGCANADK